MPIQLLLGDNHRLTLFHMDKGFIWLEETKERIHEFLNNPILNINKAFR